MFAILLTEGMDPFYQNIASFPTIIFTFFLAVTVLYWLVAVLGFVEIGILDIDIPEGEIGDGASGPNVLAGLMIRFGLAGVPVVVIISFVSLFGWLISYYIVHFLIGFSPGEFLRYLIGLPVVIFSAYIATMITAFIIRPLRPLFKRAQQQTEKYVIGQSAIVRTSVVDNSFGEAILEDGGAGLIFKVRTIGNESFVKGDKVVLLEYIKEKNIYRVVSEEDFSG
jgi:hypothetical protein